MSGGLGLKGLQLYSFLCLGSACPVAVWRGWCLATLYTILVCIGSSLTWLRNRVYEKTLCLTVLHCELLPLGRVALNYTLPAPGLLVD